MFKHAGLSKRVCKYPLGVDRHVLPTPKPPSGRVQLYAATDYLVIPTLVLVLALKYIVKTHVPFLRFY